MAANRVVVIDLGEILQRDVAVPDVGLVGRASAAPAITGTFTFAGPQAFRVLLPDDGECDVRACACEDLVRIASAGRDT
jgi:hypothetical protein